MPPSSLLSRVSMQISHRPQFITNSFKTSFRRYTSEPKVDSFKSAYGTIKSHPNNALKYLGLAGALGLGGLVAYGLSRPAHYTPSSTRASMRAIGGTSFASLVRTRISKTYAYLAGSVAITGASAFLLFTRGHAARIMSWNPIAMSIGTLIGVYGCMWACHGIDGRSNPIGKHLAWGLMSGLVGMSLLPLSVIAGGAIVQQAAMITGLIIGSMSLVAMASPDDAFLKMGPYLGVGLGVVIAASFGGMFFPGSNLLFNISLYGGLGLFGLMSAYHTQGVLHNAETQPYFDPITEQMGLYFDAVNIFVRVVQILMMNNRKR